MDKKICGSIPVNKITAIVVSQSKDNFNPKFKTQTIRSDTPLPTENIQIGERECDVIGHRYGSFVVIGAFPLYNRNKNRQWVVRCDCGMYETRRLNSLRTISESGLCCISCQKINKMGKNYSGRIPGSVFLNKINSEGYFLSRKGSYKKSFKIGNVVINQNGDEDIVVYVSNRLLKFRFNKFKIGDLITTKNKS